MITIDIEARRNKKLPIDFSKFSQRYKTENNLYIFDSPFVWALEKNLFYLLVNAEERQFDKKYKFKPSYLSYDEYGTVVLSPLLMYVNNVVSIEDFDLKRVVIPTLQAIKDTVKDNFQNIPVDEIESIRW